ncbi:MAG: hypothetical protein K6E46_03855 [Lachnospiraceae bacterium]|nr:hypothetical protein [Lachnospiraceae bacterium]
MILYYLKVLSDLLLYAAMIESSGSVISNTVVFIPVIMVMSLGPLVARYIYDRTGNALRYLGIIPIISAFLASELTLFNIVVLIPSAIYLIILVAKKNQELEYYTYTKQMRLFALVGIIYILFQTLISVIYTGGAPQTVTPYIYYLLSFVLGVIVARKLRYRRDKAHARNAHGVIYVLGVSCLIMGVFLTYQHFEEAIRAGIREALKFLLMPLAGIYAVYNDFLREYNELVLPVATGDAQKASVAEIEEVFSGYTEQNLYINLHIHEIVAVLTIIAMSLLFFFAVRAFNNRRKLSGRANFEEDVVEDIRRKKTVQRFSNREKVRKIYRRFLAIMKGRGVTISENMTSEEVLNLLTGTLGYDSAVALRNVYIHARYNDYGSVNEEDVKLAKEAIKRLSLG